MSDEWIERWFHNSPISLGGIGRNGVNFLNYAYRAVFENELDTNGVEGGEDGVERGGMSTDNTIPPFHSLDGCTVQSCLFGKVLGRPAQERSCRPDLGGSNHLI